MPVWAFRTDTIKNSSTKRQSNSHTQQSGPQYLLQKPVYAEPR